MAEPSARLLNAAHHVSYGTLPPGHDVGHEHDPQVLQLDLMKASALLEVSREDLIATLARTPSVVGDDLHIVSAEVLPGHFSTAASYADLHLGTSFSGLERTHSVELTSMADATNVMMHLSVLPHGEAERDHGCIIPMGQWRESSARLPTIGSLADLRHGDSFQLPGLKEASFRASLLDLLQPPSLRGSVADVAALFTVPDHHRTINRPPPAFIVGSPGNVSALVLPDVEDIINMPRGWQLPSAIAEARLVVESDFAHRPHIYVYIRYVRPLVAWCLLLLGWACYSAISPIYSLYPPTLQRASFRVAAWRNLAALLPFLSLFLIDVARHGMRVEHKAFLQNRSNWPLLLAGSMGSFWASTTTLMAFGFTSNFSLVAVLSSMHPYLILLYERHHGKPLSLTSVAVLAGGATGALCMVVSDAFRSLLSLAICAVASCFLVMYVKCNYRLQALLPLCCLMSINFGVGSLLSLLCTFAFEGTTLGHSPESLLWVLRDPSTFGITTAMSLSYMTGIAAFVASGKHLPMLVISVAIAMEPESSVVFEVLGGGTTPPMGLLLLGIGMITATKMWLALVSFQERRQEVVLDLTEAVHGTEACFSEVPAKH
eukprot:GGOE01041247.1.p1 GENE.GGOE01041247.1~~GGOE01041247.1.p1  ORF type:complete len:602 (-),score=166.65 GGOE01041247.1:107-1912(-)